MQLKWERLYHRSLVEPDTMSILYDTIIYYRISRCMCDIKLRYKKSYVYHGYDYIKNVMIIVTFNDVYGGKTPKILITITLNDSPLPVAYSN